MLTVGQRKKVTDVTFFRCPTVMLSALFVRFMWYCNQSLIDGSYIWDVDRTDRRATEMPHSSLGRSYVIEM